MQQESKLETAKDAFVTVGDGRGFIVAGKIDRFVITAAHCLPSLPPCDKMAYPEEKTYRELLGPLGEKPTVWAECLFVDPVGDIAVLGSPDSQALFEHADAYAALTERGALRIAKASLDEAVSMLRLDGRWVAARVEHDNVNLQLDMEPGGIEPGMSGSPIVNNDAVAVGVVNSGLANKEYPFSRDQIATSLTCCLPPWLLQQIAKLGRKGGRQGYKGRGKHSREHGSEQ